MPDSDPDISRPRLLRDGSFLENDWREIAQRRRAHNRLGFAYQVAFVRVLGRFPQQEPLEIDDSVLRFAALQLGVDPNAIRTYAERRQTVSEHQQRIREYLSLRPFDACAAEDLARFLEGEAQRMDRTASLLARASMVERMEERLSSALREHLDALLETGDDVRFTVLNRIKESTSSPSVGSMRRLLARLQLIEATGVLEVDISWVNANYQRVLLHSVRSVSADRQGAPRPAQGRAVLPGQPPRLAVSLSKCSKWQ